MSNINRLKVVLVEKGKTGRWLANELGKSNCTVSKWCSNSIQPNLQTLDKIPKLLDVNIIVNRILKMKTYCITSEFIYHISTEIHAESEEEAKRLFEDLSMEQIVGANYIPLEDLEDGLVVGIYEDKYM